MLRLSCFSMYPSPLQEKRSRKGLHCFLFIYVLNFNNLPSGNGHGRGKKVSKCFKIQGSAFESLLSVH